MAWVIKSAFESSGKAFLSVYKSSGGWVDKPKKGTLAFSAQTLIRLLNWLIDNIVLLLVICVFDKSLAYLWELIVRLFWLICSYILMSTNGLIDNV